MDKFVGKYTYVSTDNFETYLKELGVGFALRKVAGSVKADIEITADSDGYYVITTTSSIKNTTLRFKPGVEQDGDRPDGKKIKEVISVDDNGVMHHRQTPVDGNSPHSDITRELGDDGILTVTLKVNNVVALRKYKKA